jgi:hypothetical protein
VAVVTGSILQRQDRDFDRVLGCYELQQLTVDAVRLVFKPTEPLPVTGNVAGAFDTNRQRRRTPDRPLSSSRMYSASPGQSLTGSFDHGVIWFSLLFEHHVLLDPDSETRNPNCSLAITFTQGTGVD